MDSPFVVATLTISCEFYSCRSEMAQQISANGLAESVMAFNTNYSDSGLFGVYAVAKVTLLFFLSTTFIKLLIWC